MTSASSPQTILLGPLLPGELVWSYHGRLRERYPSFDFEPYFGAKPTYRKAFPTRLARMARAFNYVGAPGVTAIIENNTFFKFALPEISRVAAQSLEESLANRTFPASAPHHLIHSTNFQLRLCPHCLADDQARYGTAYWHLLHQVPEVRICPVHLAPLRASSLTAGERRFMPVSEAVSGSRLLVVGNGPAQRLIALAYRTLAERPARVNREQVGVTLEAQLEHREFFAGRQVSPELVKRLIAAFGQGIAKELKLIDNPQRLSSWGSVPKLALTCAVMGMPFAELLDHAAGVECVGRDRVTAYSQTLEGKVRLLTPLVAKELKRGTPEWVSPWALAKALTETLGAGFASNHSWKPNIRAILRAHAESLDEFHARRAA